MKFKFNQIGRFFLIILVVVNFTECKLAVKSKKKTKRNQPRERQLGIGDSLVNARAMMQQKQSDNPLSDLWDPDHLKVAKQTVDLNMTMPLNRLKLHLDDTYVVKVVAHNDEDYDALYKYFHPEEEVDDGVE